MPFWAPAIMKSRFFIVAGLSRVRRRARESPATKRPGAGLRRGRPQYTARLHVRLYFRSSGGRRSPMFYQDTASADATGDAALVPRGAGGLAGIKRADGAWATRKLREMPAYLASQNLKPANPPAPRAPHCKLRLRSSSGLRAILAVRRPSPRRRGEPTPRQRRPAIDVPYRPWPRATSLRALCFPAEELTRAVHGSNRSFSTQRRDLLPGKRAAGKRALLPALAVCTLQLGFCIAPNKTYQYLSL